MQLQKHSPVIRLSVVTINATTSPAIVKSKSRLGGVNTDVVNKSVRIIGESNKAQTYDFVGIAG